MRDRLTERNRERMTETDSGGYRDTLRHQLPPSYGLKAKLERLLWSILLELNHTGSLPFLTVKEL